MPRYRNPSPTVDLIIEIKDGQGRPGIVLIKRKNPPYGWALPGGFINYGESCEDAAIREAYEETSLRVRLVEQLHTYSAPDRDPRKHTITTAFIARAILFDSAVIFSTFTPAADRTRRNSVSRARR